MIGAELAAFTYVVEDVPLTPVFLFVRLIVRLEIVFPM